MSTNDTDTGGRVLIFATPPIAIVADIAAAGRYVNAELDHTYIDPWLAVQVKNLIDGSLPVMVYLPPEEPVINVLTYEEYRKA